MSANQMPNPWQTKMENGEGYKILTRIRFKKLTNQIGRILKLKIVNPKKILWPVQHLSLQKLTERKGDAVVYWKLEEIYTAK